MKLQKNVLSVLNDRGKHLSSLPLPSLEWAESNPPREI